MPYYYFDWTYVVLVLPCVLLSLWASANVNSTFRKYSRQYSSRRLTGAEAHSALSVADDHQCGELHHTTALDGLADPIDGHHGLFVLVVDFFSSGQS